MNHDCPSAPVERLVGHRERYGLRLYAIQKDQSLGRGQEDWQTLHWLPPFVFISKAAATRRLKELRAEALHEYPSRTDRLKFRRYRFVELIELSDISPPNVELTGRGTGKLKNKTALSPRSG